MTQTKLLFTIRQFRTSAMHILKRDVYFVDNTDIGWEKIDIEFCFCFVKLVNSWMGWMNSLEQPERP